MKRSRQDMPSPDGSPLLSLDGSSPDGSSPDKSSPDESHIINEPTMHVYVTAYGSTKFAWSMFPSYTEYDVQFTAQPGEDIVLIAKRVIREKAAAHGQTIDNITISTVNIQEVTARISYPPFIHNQSHNPDNHSIRTLAHDYSIPLIDLPRIDPTFTCKKKSYPFDSENIRYPRDQTPSIPTVPTKCYGCSIDAPGQREHEDEGGCLYIPE